MNIKICLQSDFKFLQHPKLFSHIKEYHAGDILDTIIVSNPNFECLSFTSEEAEALRSLFASVSAPILSEKRKVVLKSLPILMSVTCSSELYSCVSAASDSITLQALGEPKNSWLIEHLPPSFILFSRDQLKLLQALDITFPTEFSLLTEHVFPLIKSGKFPLNLIKPIMEDVLDMFHVISSEDKDPIPWIRDLPFIELASGEYVTPKEVFDNSIDIIAALCEGEDVFPSPSFSTQQRIKVLQDCGLRSSVSPQEVLDIIFSISVQALSEPKHVSTIQIRRASAVLEYIGTQSFQSSISDKYTLPETQGEYTFREALLRLSTERCWLPVQSSKPTNYPEQITWKGSEYTSHFISLSDSVLVVSESESYLAYLVGAKMYTVKAKGSYLLNSPSELITSNAVAQFGDIINLSKELTQKDIDSLVNSFYLYMSSQHLSDLQELKMLKEWVYIKRHNQFVSPSVVALRQDPNFRENLEPYVYILPDNLLEYKELFQISGATEFVTNSQCLLALKMISHGVDNEVNIDSQVVWKMVISILNWLTDNNEKVYTPPPDMVLYVPVETDSDWPKMEKVSNVTYTDNDFLQEHMDMIGDHDRQYKHMHRDINATLAHNLGAKPLSELLHISEDTFKDAGQYEPLITRLKNILRDYKDGLTIIKELLQNADDAEATEVNICYDARQHKTNPKKLFFSGMAEAHGPALIVHNNSAFSDEDFENITKLAGATKQHNEVKIGKFGIGFCSVYHMTDVPSFISRDQLYIFDPTLLYLKKVVKNPAQPGKAIKFRNTFISCSQQLDPYSELFGFDKKMSYKGTIFRFPFRTHASELSGTCYTEATVRELISAIKENSANLILFLQHVRAITFQRIDPGQTAPVVLLKITREVASLPLPISFPAGTELRNLHCHIDSAQSIHCQWLVSCNSESNLQKQGHTASVACPLGSSIYKCDKNFEGEMFCFLPLSQKTGLPVHVSSNFAVFNNRRGIWTSDETTSQNKREVSWNIDLIKGVIVKAYHALLLALRELSKSGLLSDYTFYDMWPKKEKLLDIWINMIEPLYQLISCNQLFYSDYCKQWLQLNESRFLTPQILCQAKEQTSTPNCVLGVLQYLSLPIVNLHLTYQPYFALEGMLLDESVFVEKFFRNLDSFEPILNTRSEVIQYMLEVYAAEYDNKTDRSLMLGRYFKGYACIPCAPDGRILKNCTEIIDSKATFATLFDESDDYFPIEQFSSRPLCYISLVELGMISKFIPYCMLVERAQTIASLYRIDKTKALKRVNMILSLCAQLGENDSPEMPSDLTVFTDTTTVHLSCIAFLPVLPSPKSYHLPMWKGASNELMCGKDLLIEGTGRFSSGVVNSDLAGSQVAFVNEGTIDEGGCGFITQSTISLLKIRKIPSLSEVIAHLVELQQTFKSQSLTEELVTSTDRMCHQIYEFLNATFGAETTLTRSAMFDSESAVVDNETLTCVWTGKEFVEVKLIAQTFWSVNGPYLYCKPSILSSKENLVRALQIKEQFSFEDIEEALKKMKEDFDDNPVDEHCQNIVKDIVSLLQKPKVDISMPQVLMLPNENFVLHPSNKLVYNDVDWAPKDPEYNYIHEIIPHHLAKKLSVLPTRSKMVENFISVSLFSSIEFGQREELTSRIQNILRDYPLDITILKELLQNADDAKATKMYLILDKRTHGTQGILSENWEKLQGPALLVWNNSVFSEKDLEGIQKLGLGSKRSDSETIGQYGIGFNVVYHLTDCPSFITRGKNIDTLCVLDPHCEYVHQANVLYPGRRYDMLSKGFWECFPDMCSSYLQSGLNNCPPEIRNGTLFRFPLRSTEKLLESSKIIPRDKKGIQTSAVITSTDMHAMLQEWIPKIKDAMLFLNHVTDVQFMVIEESNKNLDVVMKFSVEVDCSALQSQEMLLETISKFENKKGNKSVVIRYPLTISDIYWTSSGEKVSTEEKWLVQQGVGDIDNEQQTWNFVHSVKPKHGIAAPISSLQKAYLSESKAKLFLDKEKFIGRIFCFLPLPVSSNLPVHINGSFILDSSRRNLWNSTETGRKDDKSSWNSQLFLAIASSYAYFIEHTRSYYVSLKPYKTWAAVNNDIDQFYGIFPPTNILNKQFRQFAICVYKKLVEKDAEVLAVVTAAHKKKSVTDGKESDVSKQSLKVVSWYPPKSTNPSNEVYFWSFQPSTIDWKEKMETILKKIGMRLTSAKASIRDSFNKALSEPNDEIKSTSPETVHDYYCKFCAQASSTGQFPCSINDSMFKNVASFKRFTQYLLQKPKSRYNGSSKQDTDQTTITEELFFPTEPFGHPLLLTADNQLRKFQKDAKVIKSNYAHLFPKSYEDFLHPEMLDISYSSKYFVVCTSGSDNSYSFSLADKVLTNDFPSCLQTSKRVHLFKSNLSQNQLSDYWSCFKCDPVFYHNLPELLKSWALLPSSSGSLHSSEDSLVPVVPLDKQKFEKSDVALFDEIYEVLQKIGLPLLDTTITSFIPQSCPSVANKTAILKAMFHLNQEKDLSIVFGEKLQSVIHYLGKIDFRHDEESLTCLQSLSLFEDFDGVFRPMIGKKAYIWPEDASIVGFMDWFKHLSNIIFLKSTGLWVLLGSLDTLGISEIAAEDVYCKYIFPYFSALSEPNRYEHLTHIKDILFFRNNMYQESTSTYDYENMQKAMSFISSLKKLHCIGKDNLRPISDYCDHELAIFTTFSKHFHFLPDYFKDSWSKWLDFFKELGLKHTVSKSEFINLCFQVANGDHEDPIRASSVLLESLCSDSAKKKGWHSDSFFLSEVGEIPFVPTKCLPEFGWIRSGFHGSNSLMVRGRQISLTRLNGAALHQCGIYLWTFKSIVTLPSFFQSHKCQLAKQLGIVNKATVSDVIHNIRNISSSRRFTDFQHFDQYPHSNKPPDTPETKSLMSVMVENLTFLESKYRHLTSTQIQLLRDTPCIPVHSTFEKTHSWQIVLVKPSCVLCHGVIATDEYHPFLHRLDDQLSPLNNLLRPLGIESVIGFSHIQHVLMKVYECFTGQVLYPKIRICVFNILKRLIELLYQPLQPFSAIAKKESFENAGKSLLPLYLPNEENKLALSSTLLYEDDDNFKGEFDLWLEDTEYSLLKIRTKESGIAMFEKVFCELLPEVVRPKGFSTLCSQTILPECMSVSHSDVGTALSQTFRMKSALARALSACVNHYTLSQFSTKSIQDISLDYFTHTEIRTLHHLRLSIHFKVTNQTLGNLDKQFHLALSNDTQHECLYLDSQLTKESHLFLQVIEVLSNRLVELFKTKVSQLQLITGDVQENLLKIFNRLLMAQSLKAVNEILDFYCISQVKEGIEEVTFKFGSEIPICWHHRLDQSIENVFHPGETVGYEMMENHIVYAMIMHPILPEGFESFDEIPRISLRYMILTSSEDENGIEAIVLKLYKFLKGLKKERPEAVHVEDKSAMLYEIETDTAQLHQELKKENLKEICSNLKRQLDEVWKLSEEDRKKAIRRLYLKWHPDKNLDNPELAEEVLKFLNSEISRRNAERDIQREDLNRSARQQREYYEREWSSEASTSKSGFASGGWINDTVRMPAFDDTNICPKRNKDEGRRWLKQADANFNSLLLLHSGSQNNPKVCGDVCFMAHQVAEKALKGGKYFVCGLDSTSLHSHNLSTHACGLQSEHPGETHGLVAHTAQLENYYLDPRYPNRWPLGVIPADQYSYQQAEAAKNHAQAILDIIKNIMQEN